MSVTCPKCRTTISTSDPEFILREQITALRSQVAELQAKLDEAMDSYYAAMEMGRMLQAKLDEYQPVINMLILCGEKECRDIKNYPLKLRAILDSMIDYRRKLDEQGKQEPVAYLWPAIGNHPASIHWPAEVAHDAAIRNVAEPLYRLSPNTEAMVERARAEEREECAKICDDIHHDWRWDDEPDSDSGPRSCATAIRARKGE